jgi:predicted metal-binding membrane protein
MTSIPGVANLSRRAVADRLLLGLLFAGSAALTFAWCRSMSNMGGMPMPGGWTMSMMWMRMPGQTWPGMTASFLIMWIVMTAAMMLPSFTPMLRAYETGVKERNDRVPPLAAVCAGYLAVWTSLGAVLFVLGVAIAELTMRDAGLARLVPYASVAVVVCAGVLQMTPWKARQLTCCRAATRTHAGEAGIRAAWHHGIALGLACSRSCAGLVAVQMALGMMDMRVMVAVGAAITAERLAPHGVRTARVIGVALMLSAAI